MKRQLKSFIVGNSVLLVFYIFMASNAWAMPPEWYIRCDMECGFPDSSLCWCTCMYDNWEPFPMGFPAPGPDADGDFYQDTDSGYGICIDNCPGYYNPNQEDADLDGTGDFCDPDTVYGYFSGAVPEGNGVRAISYSCGSVVPAAEAFTDTDGYYALGDLEDGKYTIQSEDTSYSTENDRVTIPQTEIESYGFTATAD